MNPRPDGTFDKGQEDLLKGIGKWLKQNGEAIYGTRPWITYGEGHLEDLFYTWINQVTEHHLEIYSQILVNLMRRILDLLKKMELICHCLRNTFSKKITYKIIDN